MYEQLTIKGFFADPSETAEEPAHQADPSLAPEDKVKEPPPRKSSREREER